MVISKNKVDVADSHFCQCIVGTYTLTKNCYSKINGITNDGSSKNDHNMLWLASLKLPYMEVFKHFSDNLLSHSAQCITLLQV